MVKTIKINFLLKNLILSLVLISLFFLFNLYKVIDREKASELDIQINKIQSEIDTKNKDIMQVNRIIKAVNSRYKDYLSKIEKEKDLTIDSSILSIEMNDFFELLNKYYDNKIFKIHVFNVVPDDEYINLAVITLTFDFYHDFKNDVELSNDLEKTIIKNVYMDILNKFENSLSILKEKSSLDLENKNIKLYFIKRIIGN